MASWWNIDDHLRSRGFTVHAHTGGQTTRACSGTSFHCDPPGSAADFGTAQYTSGQLWAIFDALAPFAYGPNRIIEELAYANRAIDGGHDVLGGWADHYDHLHSALVPGRLLPVGSIPPPPPPAPKKNPAVAGMLLQRDDGAVYLIGAGHIHHVPTWEEVDRLKFVGAVGPVTVQGLEVVGWARTFGVPGWDQESTYQ